MSDIEKNDLVSKGSVALDSKGHDTAVLQESLQPHSSGQEPVSHTDYMQRCIALAKQAEEAGEVPVGAIVVYQNKIIAEGFNQPISSSDPTSHAELIALRKACEYFENYRLPKDVKVYVTLEPCAMCAGAMVHARVSEVIFGASDEKTGAAGSVFNVLSGNARNHTVSAIKGILKDECVHLLRDFFHKKRATKSSSKPSSK